jgi:hypothetical protein
VAGGRSEKHRWPADERGGAPVSQPQQETSGDYGYDLAHEAPTGGRRHEEADHPTRAVVHPGGTSDRGEDYGYDEAHSF